MGISAEDEPPSVRSRARQAVKAQVAEIALQLFLTHGFERTTTDQIAKAAGMSRATFFRYFPTKEDVVLTLVEDLAEQTRDALTRRPRDEPVWTALRHALEPPVRDQAKDLDAALQTARVIVESPSIRARLHERNRRWRELLLPEVTRRITSATTSRPDPAASALIASALSCLDAAIEAWVREGGSLPLPGLLDEAMTAVHPLTTPVGRTAHRRARA
jgi:AcrR family transcriptional regulator